MFATVTNESTGTAGGTHIRIVHVWVIVFRTLKSYFSIIVYFSYFTINFCLIIDLGIQN